MKFWISNKIEWWLISFASCNFLFPGISLFRHVANGGLSFFKNPLLQLLHILILLLHDWKLDGQFQIIYFYFFARKEFQFFEGQLKRVNWVLLTSFTQYSYSVLTYSVRSLTHSVALSIWVSSLRPDSAHSFRPRALVEAT